MELPKGLQGDVCKLNMDSSDKMNSLYFKVYHFFSDKINPECCCSFVFFRMSSNHPVGPSGVGPGCTDKTLLSAIASALHTSAAPITGQLSAAVEKNPGVWLNTTQPLCKAFIVTDEDIRWAIAEHLHTRIAFFVFTVLHPDC